MTEGINSVTLVKKFAKMGIRGITTEMPTALLHQVSKLLTKYGTLAEVKVSVSRGILEQHGLMAFGSFTIPHS